MRKCAYMVVKMHTLVKALKALSEDTRLRIINSEKCDMQINSEYDSAFENYTISFFPASSDGWEWQGGKMARAVIELSGNITSSMQRICEVNDSCRCNPSEKLASFYLNNACVIVEERKITVYNARDETHVKDLIDWLRQNLISMWDLYREEDTICLRT